MVLRPSRATGLKEVVSMGWKRIVGFVLLAGCLLVSPECSKKGERDTGSRARRGGTPFTPPKTGPAGSDGWEPYVKPLTLKKDTVKGVAPGHGSPEAAVVHFYASRLRGDDRYKEVLPPGWEQSGMLRRKLDKMSSWTFHEVTLLKRKKIELGYWIKLRMTIGYRGRTKTGTDGATVNRINGKWYVTRPPT
jgi:hypothetical protein